VKQRGIVRLVAVLAPKRPPADKAGYDKSALAVCALGRLIAVRCDFDREGVLNIRTRLGTPVYIAHQDYLRNGHAGVLARSYEGCEVHPAGAA
jgi:hypothetical protein